MKKRLLTIAMTLAMVLSLLPTGVWAADTELDALRGALEAFDAAKDADSTNYYSPSWETMEQLGVGAAYLERYSGGDQEAASYEAALEAIRTQVFGLRLDDANLSADEGAADYHATQFLDSMEGLKILDLSTVSGVSAVDNSDMEVLAGLKIAKNLVALDLAYTDVTSLDFLQAGTDGTAPFGDLDTLFLNGLDNLDVDALVDAAKLMPNLHYVHLSDTTVTGTQAQAALDAAATLVARNTGPGEDYLFCPPDGTRVIAVIANEGGTVARRTDGSAAVNLIPGQAVETVAGTLAVSEVHDTNPGARVYYDIKADAGYEITAIKQTEVPDGTTINLSVPADCTSYTHSFGSTGDYILEITFTPTASTGRHTVAFTISDGGRLEERRTGKEIPTGERVPVEEDEFLHVRVIPDEGYELSSFRVNETERKDGLWTDTSDGYTYYDFGSVDEDLNVVVQFLREGSASVPGDDDDDSGSSSGGSGGSSGSSGGSSGSREEDDASGGGDAVSPVDSLADVSESDWYYEAVSYATGAGIMSGVSETEFAPNATLTRSMAAQMLWALEGKPDLPDGNLGYPYADVIPGSWYVDAVYWVRQQGIITGYNAEQFAPDAPLTREQLCLILYNYAKWAGYDVSGGVALGGYADADSASAWAVEALEWAVDAGLISGRGGNTLAPAGTATRAEIAQIFMNFLENVAG